MSTPNSPTDPPPYGPPPGWNPPPYGPPPYGPPPYGPPPYGPPPGWNPPPYGPPPYGQEPFGPRYAPKGRNRAPFVLGGIIGVIGLVVVALGFVGPAYFTSTVFDQTALQNGVQGVLTSSYGQKADSVTCPAQQKVTAGSTFTCQATIGGQQRPVKLTVKNRDGTYEVARP